MAVRRRWILPLRGDWREWFGIVVILTGFLLPGCGSTMDLSSSWNADEVTIDGNAREWKTGLTKLKDANVFLGVQNDRDFLYVCLTSPDQQFRRQLIGTGLSVWFESEEGKRVGVLFPLGIVNQRGMLPSDQGEGSEPGDREHMFTQALQDLEILGPGKGDRNLFSTVQVPGISVKVGTSETSTAYELKIPLARSGDHPYAVGAQPGSTVKIDIQTGKFDSGSRPEGMGEGMRGGGGGRRPRGGGGGGFGGGMGGERGEGGGSQNPRGTRPEPLDVSVNVALANPQSGTSHSD